MSLTIYDYDFKNFGRPYFYDKMKEVESLVDMGDHFRFWIPNTDLYIFLTFSSFVWVKYSDGENPILLCFEDVIELAPKEVVQNLMFHIDIFKHERRIEKKYRKEK